MQLRQPVMRPACDESGRWHPLADLDCLFAGLGPGSVNLEDFRPMHLALAAVGHQSGLRVAPAGERSRPFASALDIETLHAQRDHGAIRQPDDGRRNALGDDIHHDLVEYGQCFRCPAEHHQAASATQARQHEEIVVVSRASSDSGLLQHRQRLDRRLSLHYLNAFPKGDEIGQLVVWIVVLQHATQTRYPARCAGGLAHAAEMKYQPEHSARGLLGRALLEVTALCTIKQSDGLLIPTKQMGRNGVALEIFRAQILLSRGELGVLLSPVARRGSHTRQVGFHAASRI